MKKIVSIIVLLLMVTPGFANDMQKAYEAKNLKIENHNTKDLLLSDYKHYLNGGGSLYGVIMAQINSLGYSINKQDEINLEYAYKLKNDYDCYIKHFDKNFCKIEGYSINDNTYKQLNNDIKNVISAFNYLFKN